MARRAGWYPHPTMVDSQGYWDGERWTDHVAPLGNEWTGQAPPAAATPVPSVAAPRAREEKDDSAGLVLLGLFLSLLFPIVGFIMGIVLLTKNRVGPGLACVAISSLIMAALAAVYLTA